MSGKFEDRTTGICAQCGEMSPEAGFTTKKVIYQKFNSEIRKWFTRETLFTVCDNNKCGADIQSAYEG